MHIDPSTGLLTEARQVPCPNCSQRPEMTDISLLVIHNISLPPGEYGQGHIEAFFTNHLDPKLHPYFETICDLQVSSHLLIDRQGAITQFVPFTARAWHAGVSSFAGRDNCNDYSIGIELEGTDEEAYTQAQYAALTSVSRAIMACWPAITPERIVGHSDIAPGRKTDPGPAFDWDAYRRALMGA